MSEADLMTEQPHPVRVPGWLITACRWLAVIGGLVLMAMMLMTVVSVVKRGVLGAPIPGDYELIEMGSAIVISCFLPWCQVSGGNVLVDFFTMKAPARVNHLLEAGGDLLYLLIGILLVWRMWHGAVEAHQYDEQSMVLRVRIWWSFIIIIPAFLLLIVTTFATLLGHLREARK